MKHITAHHDPALAARVVNQTPLLYRAGPDPAADRPGHVRAGSSLALVRGRLVIIQDDANLIALLHPPDASVEAILLPAGHQGKRLFDDGRGNKRWKLDLEACAAVPAGLEEWLVAFGSGSTPLRERLVVLSNLDGETPQVAVYDAPAFYAALRAAADFAGSELNIEGAVYLGDGRLRLFQRGNGAPRGDVQPVNATADVSWPALHAYLGDPRPDAAFTLDDVTQYDLGRVAGVRLTFTDAARCGDTLFFSATAEASPDAIHDGPVAASAIGLIHPGGAARWTVLEDVQGGIFPGKVEGLAFQPEESGRAYVIVDKDDPETPSQLCQVELAGSWS
ncbi:MAG: hypothetical protein L0332_19160 [Chloroflexi bacterium]|nr:hypothetical protein [Chloroflexota bacterium]